MTVVKNVEQYLWYEIVNTIDVLLRFWTAPKELNHKLTDQFHTLKEAFRLFMLDLDVEDFKNLKMFKEPKLPSEEKETKKSENTSSNQKVKTKIAESGKQLKLFFVKTSKKTLLTLVLGIEQLGSYLTKKLMKDLPDYENRRKE